MTCAVCPNCGTDLERFERIQSGDLDLQLHQVKWKGAIVPLRPAGRLLVHSIVRAKGLPVKTAGLMDAMGCTGEAMNPLNVVRVQTSLARKAFRSIDPSFAAIVTVWGSGLRWAL